MRNHLVMIGLLLGAIAGCSSESSQKADHAMRVAEPAGAISSSRNQAALPLSTVAFHPDRGELLAYEGNVMPVERGATKWYPVELSEEHALRAVVTGNLRVNTPEGRPLNFQYKRHVEHKNGNWTWVGEMDGAEPGREAVLTFGEKAVFGSIPYDNAEPLKLAMSGGRTWIVQTDPVLAAAGNRMAPKEPDFLIPGTSGTNQGGAMKTMASAPPMAFSHAGTHATVDIALGYTNGLAASLGGQSQAITRLTHLVDLTNQAYTASGVDGELRLVRTVMVDYPDATSNQTALFELTGVECTPGTGANLPGGSVDCTPVGQPAALQPLIQAREIYRADVVSLVRQFNNANGSCGIGWMLGAGQQEITAADADYAMSVVSDTSSTGSCREDTLAHEVGHNMGLQHDRETAQGTDDTDNDGNLLDPQEYGRYPYAFGHSSAAGAGSFYTIMALRRAGQVGYMVFSNPSLTSCGGQPCGIVDEADNARSLNQTIPVVAGFRSALAPAPPRNDVNFDARTDLIWFKPGLVDIWLMSGYNIGGTQGYSSASNLYPYVTGEMSGVGGIDIGWRDNTGKLIYWIGGPTYARSMQEHALSFGWRLQAAGDRNGDGFADLFFRSAVDGRVMYWHMGAGQQRLSYQAFALAPEFELISTGDFNGDGTTDLLFRRRADGATQLWSSTGDTFTVTNPGGLSKYWRPSNSFDYDGDGDSDLVWRSDIDHRVLIWIMQGGVRVDYVVFESDPTRQLLASGDLNGDGLGDLVWRRNDGAVSVWLRSGTGFVSRYIGTKDATWQLVRGGI